MLGGLFGSGVIIGLLVSAPMGPIGLLCVQRTLNKGRWHGFVSGLGAALSDVIYAAITVFFMGLLVNFIETNQSLLQISGSIVLGLFGYYIYQSDPVKRIQKNREVGLSYVQDFLSAFFVTFSNVLIVLLFIGLYARFSFVLPSHSVWQILKGLAGVAFGAVLWWFTITFLVSLMRPWFNIRGVRMLNRVVGIVILTFSVVGLVYSFIT